MDCGAAAQFDTEGNLWCVSDNTEILKFEAADLTKSGLIGPVLRAHDSERGDYLTGLGFDHLGNVWTVGAGKAWYRRYELAALTTTTTAMDPTFKLEMQGAGLVLDEAGNMFSLFLGGIRQATVVRLDAEQLTGTGAATVAEAVGVDTNITLTTIQPALSLTPSLPYTESPTIFFSPAGELLTLTNTVDRYSVEQLGRMGTAIASPPETTFQIASTPGSGFWLYGAYDPEGNLWVASKKTIAKVPAAQLAKTGMVGFKSPVNIPILSLYNSGLLVH